MNTTKSIHDSIGDCNTTVGGVEKEPEKLLQELLSEIEILALSKDASAETRLEAILKKTKAAERVLRTLSETSFDGFLTKLKRDEKKTTT